MTPLGRLALWAQRRRWPVPEMLRRLLRSVAERGPSDATAPGLVDGWSGPFLVHDAAAGRGLAALGPDPVSRAVPSPVGHGDRLHCLVATDGLDVGGTEEVAAFLAHRLPEVGIATTVMYIDPTAGANHGSEARLADALRRAGVEVVDAARDDGRTWLARRRPDVVSAHGAPSWILEGAADLGIPIVETLHGMHSLFGADPHREAVRSQPISMLVAVSDLVREQYLAHNPAFPADRIVTIPNGIAHEDLPLADRGAAREWLGFRDEFVFVSLGRHCLQKNPYGLVTAFGELAATHPQVHLVISGRVDDALYARQVRALRDHLSCRDRVQLRDHCSRSMALLAAADAFVLDSFFEGWSLASMEALTAGLPVVLSEVGGAREQVGGGRGGYIVPNPAGDPRKVDWKAIRRARYRVQENKDGLVDAMAAIVEARDHWAASRHQLREESLGRFSAKAWVNAHARILASAVRDQRSTPAPRETRAAR